MQQWLSAVIFWGIYSKLGAVGILALVFVLYCAIVAVITRLSWHISGGNLIATFLAACYLPPRSRWSWYRGQWLLRC